MFHIDINCDMGEGFLNDEAIMPLISSVNIACGYHAGDEDTMRRTIEKAMEYDVAIGAHPSYPDRANFGRTDLLDTKLKPKDLPAIIADQVVQLQELCGEFGASLHHVKPHGALYNRAARDASVSTLVCMAIEETFPGLLLYGLSGSGMEEAAAEYNIHFIREGFADRTYQEDGSLTSRNDPGSMITDPEQCVQQVLQMIHRNTVNTATGKTIELKADTICIHGDGPHALIFAKAIHEALRHHDITLSSPEKVS